MRGSYRTLLSPVKKLSCVEDDQDLVLNFEIPSGAYATILINEITKSESLDMGLVLKE